MERIEPIKVYAIAHLVETDAGELVWSVPTMHREWKNEKEAKAALQRLRDRRIAEGASGFRSPDRVKLVSRYSYPWTEVK